jgi:hypothetical protein
MSRTYDNEKKTSQSTFSFKPTASFLQTRDFAPLQTDLDEDATPRPSGYTENFLEKIINQRGTESSDTPVQAKPMNRLKALQAKRMAIQAKLNIGEPNDKYEQEADATASKVVQQINSSTQDQSVQKEEGMKEDDKLQMKPLVQRSENSGDSEASSDVEGAINSARGSGQQLPNRLRRKMENAMGVDFSGVKIHTDGKADVLNRSLNARAFTTGQDIFFKKGEYNPDSVEGQKLIAHESTHTIQQGAVPALQPKLQSNNSSIPSIQLDDDDDSVTTRPRSNAMSLAKPQPTRPRSNAISNPKKQPNESSEPIETSSRIGTSEPEESSSKTTTIGEGTVTTTETSDSVFTGAEASMKTVIEASDDTVRKSFEGLARAGVFGEKAAKRQIETSSGTTATMEGKASGMMGVETKLSSEVISTMESLTALFEASVKAGFGGDLEGALSVSNGPFAAQLKGKIGGFVGIWAEAKGSLNLTRVGIALEGSAKAGVGAKSEGEVTMGVSVADLGIEGGGSYEALAGAEAGVEGKFSIGLHGIEAKGKAEAFAGAKVKGTAKASVNYKGKVLFKISAEAEASAGVGGEIEGEFSFSNGKLVVGGKLAAALGIGLGGGVKVEVDFFEIGSAIVDLVKRAFTKKVLDNRSTGDQDREQMPEDKQAQMIDQLYEGLYPHVKAYVEKKVSRQSQGKATHFVKLEMIQKIIDDKIRTKSPYKALVPYLESDIALRTAISAAMGSRLKYIDIQEGVIRAFDAS